MGIVVVVGEWGGAAEVLCWVILLQTQLQISALSKPVFIRLVNPGYKSPPKEDQHKKKKTKTARPPRPVFA